MRLYPQQVIRGIQILQHTLKPQHTIVAIEDNKPDALSVFQTATKNSDILTVSIPTKYPAGGEKQLIQEKCQVAAFLWTWELPCLMWALVMLLSKQLITEKH